MSRWEAYHNLCDKYTKWEIINLSKHTKKYIWKKIKHKLLETDGNWQSVVFFIDEGSKNKQ